jgi:hypothetical protein
MNCFWSILSGYVGTAREYALSIADWFEHHAGLGGWVGAIGAITAIFVTWGLARSEYLRVQRIESNRVNSEIALFARITSEFQPLVQRFLELVDANDPKAENYHIQQQDDARFLRAADLNGMPVTQWPSVESYDAFKRYFLASNRLMQTPLTEQAKPTMEARRTAYDGTYESLQRALAAARK